MLVNLLIVLGIGAMLVHAVNVVIADRMGDRFGSLICAVAYVGLFYLIFVK